MAGAAVPDFPVGVLSDVSLYRDIFRLKRSRRIPTIGRLIRDLRETPGNLDTPCMISIRGANNDGYVQVQVGAAKYLSHRVMWAAHNGQWPPADQEVRHRCDTRGCSAPDHLELGTHQDNVDDMVRRHRQRNAKPKTPEVIERIRQLRDEGKAHHVIAALLGIDRRTVRRYLS